jgi:hypothetical protein
MRTFFINGYGVPDDILRDGNYGAYLMECLRTIVVFSQGEPVEIHLGGGATDVNSPGRTEAGEMARWLATNEFDYDVELLLSQALFLPISRTIDARENLEALQERIGRGTQVGIFCEHARQDWMQVLALRLFDDATVFPIDFDAGRSKYARLLHAAKLPMRILGLYSDTVRRRIELPLRRAFIRWKSLRSGHRP